MEIAQVPANTSDVERMVVDGEVIADGGRAKQVLRSKIEEFSQRCSPLRGVFCMLNEQFNVNEINRTRECNRTLLMHLAELLEPN